MAKTVTLTHEYRFPSDMVWDVVTDLDHLQTVTSGMIKFKSLPSGKIFEGQNIKVGVSLFGWFPYQDYEMTLVELDNVNRRLRSDEKGAGVEYWRHTLHVVDITDGCRIDESIEIEAGFMSPLFAMWARFMYNRRHKPRIEILNSLNKTS